MLRELEGFKQIIPLLKKHPVAGMKYKNTTLFGFTIFMKEESRCFVINHKCQDTMSMSIVNSFTPKQFTTFVEHILTELVEIQKLNLAHGDIKLDNIMKCSGKYELIDWENSRPLSYSFLKHNRYRNRFFTIKFPKTKTNFDFFKRVFFFI